MTYEEPQPDHVCDKHCVAAERDAVVGKVIAPHVAIRPNAYLDIEALRTHLESWPDQPPYCTVCGHEMLTEGDLYSYDRLREAHALVELDPED